MSSDTRRRFASYTIKLASSQKATVLVELVFESTTWLQTGSFSVCHLRRHSVDVQVESLEALDILPSLIGTEFDLSELDTLIQSLQGDLLLETDLNEDED